MFDRFLELGARLRELPEEVICKAAEANPWFGADDVRRAAGAIADQMLDPAKLRAWWPERQVGRPLKTGVVMAGNIPLVGFFDMLCVLAAGCECFYKPSSKDAVLMDFVAESLPARRWEGEVVDAVIAMGGDNTRRALSGRFAGLPLLLRGSRGSVAVVDDDSDPGALADDIFAYSGLGCRNVSHLFLPVGYDLGRLVEAFDRRSPPSAGYVNNFVQRRAMLRMTGEEFVEGGYFILRRGDEFPEYISEITYGFGAPEEWLAAHEGEVQCVVGGDGVAFGHAHRPTLTDYPDGVDTMRWLLGL